MGPKALQLAAAFVVVQLLLPQADSVRTKLRKQRSKSLQAQQPANGDYLYDYYENYDDYDERNETITTTTPPPPSVTSNTASRGGLPTETFYRSALSTDSPAQTTIRSFIQEVRDDLHTTPERNPLPTEIVPGESNMINAVAVPGPRVNNILFMKKMISKISITSIIFII